MQCRACAYENEAASRFCVACGVSLAPVCARCGRDVPETARFCASCGEPRKPDARIADVPGERKQATVLFADVAGSTERIAGMDAEAAMDFLHPIVMVMARAVNRYDGTVLRTLGDGLKAAFGVPHAREGHAVLACHAALAMRAAVAELPNAPPIRIGLHSGEVVSGKLHSGSIDRAGCDRPHRASGQPDRAGSPARRDLPEPRMPDPAPRLLRHRDAWSARVEGYSRSGGDLPVARPETGRQQRAFPRRIADAVARAGMELETLQRALQDTAPGSPRVIGISGPPGVGKSRLCFEFGEWCRERQIKVLEARAQVHSRSTPLLPVLEALRAFFRIEPDMDRRSWRGRGSSRP